MNMQIENLSPGLAITMANQYLEVMIDMGVERLSPKQNKIYNGLRAVHEIAEAEFQMQSSPSSFRKHFEEMKDFHKRVLEESTPELNQYLNCWGL